MEGIFMRIFIFALVVAAWACRAAPAAGQTDTLDALSPEACSPDSLPEGGGDSLMQYEMVRLSLDEVATLRNYLARNCWEHALRSYFIRSRAKDLVDWVVYIDSAGRVHQAVTRGPELRREFRGEKYVWAIVFSDTVPGLGEAEERPLLFSRRSVNYRRDPVLTSIARAIAGRFLSGVEPAGDATLRDTSQTIVLRRLSMDSTGNRMYVAHGRFELAEDAIIELALKGDSGRTLTPRVRSAFTNIENHGRSRWDVGIAAGAWMGSRTEVDEGTRVTSRRELQPNVYVMGYLNLFPPRLPSRRTSFGPAIGVNVARGGVLDELVLAFAVGRLRGGDVGAFVGGSWTNVSVLEEVQGQVPHRREKRDLHLLMALDLRL
jgi:hypothetical protein